MALVESIVSAVAGPAKKYLAVIEAGLAISLIAGSFFYGQHVANTANEAANAKAQLALTTAWQAKVDAEHNRMNDISAQLEAKVATLQPVYTTINRKVEKETVKTVYTDPACALPQSGVDLINQNVDELNAKRKEK